MKQLINKSSVLLVAIMLLITSATYAQQRRNGQRGNGGQAKMERVHAMKIGYITQHLQLTSSQAERFWPVYNRYEQELRETRMRFIKNRRAQAQKQEMTDAEARAQIENNLDLQEAVIDLKKRYNNEFLKIISARQLMDLYEAEKGFRQTLMKEMRSRQERKAKARR